MVTVDRRAGSASLLSPLKKLGVPAEAGTLEFGDISFVGNGPEGMPIPIGIEHKQVLDVLKCITDGRFAGHQLPGLAANYQYVWLLVEGEYRGDMHTGNLQIKGNRGYFHNANLGGRYFMYRDMQSWLNTMELRGGIRVARTQNQTETCYWLAAMYHWWCDSQFEEHKSHLAIQTTFDGDRSILVRPSILRLVAAQLPGIGFEKSGSVANYFDSVRAMANAPAAEWEKIEGIGKTIARRVVNAISGRSS